MPVLASWQVAKGLAPLPVLAPLAQAGLPVLAHLAIEPEVLVELLSRQRSVPAFCAGSPG